MPGLISMNTKCHQTIREVRIATGWSTLHVMDVAAACAAQRPMLVPDREGVMRCTMVTPRRRSHLELDGMIPRGEGAICADILIFHEIAEN
jgi:hypothetical protein